MLSSVVRAALVPRRGDLVFDKLKELERIDVPSLTDDELHVLVVEEQALSSQLAAIRARHLAEWEARRVWADDGSKTAWARLSRECKLSARSARQEVLRAKRLRTMPATAVAFVEGKLTADQVDLLTHANQAGIEYLFARDESLLIAEIVSSRHPVAQRLIEYWIEHAFEEAGRERSRPDPAGRHVTAVRSFNGHIDLSGWLDAIAGTEFIDELTSVEQELFEHDWAATRACCGNRAVAGDLPRTGRQRRHDALVVMARNSRACRHGTYRQPRPLVTLHAGVGTFARMCELADGTVVSPSQVFPLLADADIETIVFDGPRRVLEVGTRERFFTGALRRAIEVRDRHCQHPAGCDVVAEHCQIDHIVPYARGGLTTQDNGRCACAVHNRRRASHDWNVRPPP